jgi:hypothetical protein
MNDQYKMCRMELNPIISIIIMMCDVKALQLKTKEAVVRLNKRCLKEKKRFSA